MEDSIGFIGAGRIAYILLERLRRIGKLPSKVIVSDSNSQAAENLKSKIPEIEVLENGNQVAASQDKVFIGVHPPSMNLVLEEIKICLKPESFLISLVPKFSIENISQSLDGFNQIVRMIPNAPSLIGSGFNPTVFSSTIKSQDRKNLLSFFSSWGKSPEVPESELEAYVILTAVGPTYFWFQWIELLHLMESFGLSQKDIEVGLSEMVFGSIKTLFESGISMTEVENLVKIKPLGSDEDVICQMYRSNLAELHSKLSPSV